MISLYSETRKIDFKELFSKNEDLIRDFPFHNSKVNIKDPRFQIALSKCILKSDFNLKVVLDDNHLIPPIPNRYNYVKWVHKLLSYFNLNDSKLSPLILDVGTGSSCIYPLLGTKKFGWDFIASDIDADSLEFSKKNIELNLLNEKIQVCQVDTSEYLQASLNKFITTIPNSVESSSIDDGYSSFIHSCFLEELNADINPSADVSISAIVVRMRGPIRKALANVERLKNDLLIRECNFCQHLNNQIKKIPSKLLPFVDTAPPKLYATMCNPPFYDLDETIHQNGKAICTGSFNEMRTQGGEVSIIVFPYCFMCFIVLYCH